MKEYKSYYAIFEKVNKNKYSIEFPDLDVATSAVDEEDAWFSARDLLGVVLKGLEEDGLPIPEPSKKKEIKKLLKNKKEYIEKVDPLFKDSITSANYLFPAIFEYDKKADAYSIHFPDIPGAYTSATSIRYCWEMAEDVLTIVLTMMEERDEEIPEPTPIYKLKVKGKKDFVSLVPADTVEYKKFLAKYC